MDSYEINGPWFITHPFCRGGYQPPVEGSKVSLRFSGGWYPPLRGDWSGEHSSPLQRSIPPTYSPVLGQNLQNMAVGVLDEIDPGRQLVKDQTHGPVLCLETVEVLGHQGRVGGVVPQLIGFRPGGLLAQLQLEVGDAVPQEDQLPAPVGHVQLPLDGQPQGFLIKCSAAGQIQHPDADMVHGNHRMFLPLLDFCPHFTTEPEGGQGRSFFQKKGKSLYANRQKWGMI